RAHVRAVQLRLREVSSAQVTSQEGGAGERCACKVGLLETARFHRRTPKTCVRERRVVELTIHEAHVHELSLWELCPRQPALAQLDAREAHAVPFDHRQ